MQNQHNENLNYKRNIKYENELLKKLEAFKSAIEWSDLVGLLGGIDETFEKYDPGYIAYISLLVKRLSQCLNPMLPTGVHLKTLETYTIIFESIKKEEFLENYTVLTMNLFSFGLNCRILVTSEYLTLIRDHIIPYLGNVPSEGAILALLPTLESESSEFFEETYSSLVQIREQIGNNNFFKYVFNIYIEYSELQGSIVNMLGRMKIGNLQEYETITRAFCYGLESEKTHIMRSVLDMTKRDFPMGEIVEEWNEGSLECNARLIRNVLLLFLRKEAGINKRVYKWFEAADEVDEEAIKYFERGIRTFLSKDEEELLIFYKIIYALSDKENLANILINKLMLYSLNYLMIADQIKRIKYSKFNKILGSIGIDYIWRIFYEKMKELFSKCTEDNENSNLEDISKEIPDKESFIIKELSEINICKLFEIIFFMIKNFKIINTNARTIHLPLLANVIARNKCKVDSKQIYEFFEIFLEYSEYREGVMWLETIDDIADHAYAKETFTTIAKLNIHRHIGKELASSKHYDILNNKNSNIERLIGENNKKFFYDGVVINAVSEQIGDFFEINFNDKIYRCNSYGNGFNYKSNYVSKTNLRKNQEFNYIKNTSNNKNIKTDYKSDGLDIYDNEKSNYNEYYTKNDCIIFQHFIEKYGLSIFPDEFYDRLGCFLTRNYNFLRLVELVSTHINHEKLLINVWNDYVFYKNPIFVILYDLNSLLIKNMQIIGKDDLYQLLLVSTNMPQSSELQNYFELLFCVSSKSGDSVEFNNLLLAINNPSNLLEFCLKKILCGQIDRQNGVYLECPEFNKLYVSLGIISKLLNNVECQSLLRNNAQTTCSEIRKYLGDTLFKALGYLLEILLETENEEVYIPEKENSSRLIKKNNDINGTEELKENSEISANLNKIAIGSKKDKICDDRKTSFNIPREKFTDLNDFSDNGNLNIIYKQSNNASNEIIQKKGFEIYHRLRKLEMKVKFEDLKAIKKTIQKFSYDFTILKWAFPIVSTDYIFVIETYSQFYRETFPLVEDKDRLKFFTELIEWPGRLRLCDLKEIMNYFDFTSKELFYIRAIEIIGKGLKQELEEHLSSIIDLLWIRNPKLFRTVFQKQNNKKNIFKLMNSKIELLEAIIKEGKIKLARSLCRVLKKTERIELFNRFYNWFKNELNSKRDYDIFLLIIELIVNEEDLQRYEKEADNIIKSEKSTESETELFNLIKYSRFNDLSNNKYNDIKNIRFNSNNSNNISINSSKTNFNMNSNESIQIIGNSSIYGIQETIKTVGISADKLSFILLSILSSLNFHISSAIKLDISFNTELEILFKIFNVIIQKPDIINYFCTILFILLSSKKYHSQAFILIFSTIIKFPTSLPFAQAFLDYFNDSFFTTRIFEKKIILRIISQTHYSQLDKIRSEDFVYGSKILTPLIIRLFNNLDGSYFLSQYNNLLQKIHALRRFSFLILINYSNFFEIENKLVTAISTLIFDDIFVKSELYRLSTIMIFRFDHMSLIHLFPILISDFLQILFTPNISLILLIRIFTCIDAWIWSGNTVSNIKLLFNDPRFISKISFFNNNQFISSEQSCLNNNSHYVLYKSGIDNIKFEKNTFMPLLLFPKSIDDLKHYLKEAPEFYRWATNKFLEHDELGYNDYLLNTFYMEE